MSQKDLDALRTKIRATDDQILSLIRQRLDLAREIGQVKFSNNIPVKDFKVEKDVLERNLAAGNQLGLYEPLTTEITRLLIRYSVLTQDEFQSQEKRSETRVRRRILILGGRGRMGIWLSDFFDSFGHQVVHYDPTAAGQPTPDRIAKKYDLLDQLDDAARQADVIVIAAPISAAAGLIDHLATTGTKALVLDVCSLKTPLIPSIQKAAAAGLNIGSVHPMFGPQVDMLAGRNIVICDTGIRETTEAATALFSGTTAQLVTIKLEEHDRSMSYVLGLSHLVNLIFADVLAHSGFEASELMEVASTTYLNQSGVARAVVAENPGLYFEIQYENSYTPQLIDSIRKSVELWFNAISSKDRSSFTQRMKKADTYMREGVDPK